MSCQHSSCTPARYPCLTSTVAVIARLRRGSADIRHRSRPSAIFEGSKGSHRSGSSHHGHQCSLRHYRHYRNYGALSPLIALPCRCLLGLESSCIIVSHDSAVPAITPEAKTHTRDSVSFLNRRCAKSHALSLPRPRLVGLDLDLYYR